MSFYIYKKNKGIIVNKILFITLILITGYFFGCTEETVLEPPYTNTPVITSTANAFAFTLAANSYSANTVYELYFTSDSLAFSIVVSGYSSGNGSLTIMDVNSSTVYSESLQGNNVHAFTQTNKGIPKKIILLFITCVCTVIRNF